MNLFIKKLVKEDKIKIVEPSDEVSKAYLKKSEKSLISSKTLLDIGNYEDATALAYYSMYYSALSLLFKCGIKSENHTATIILLKDIFKIENKEIEKAKKERVDKQYYVDFSVTKKEVEEGIKIAEDFNSIIKEKIDKLKESEKINYKDEFEKTYF